MSVASKIKKIFKGTPYEGGHIYKGWHSAWQREGWIVRPFGKNEIYLGRNGKDAQEKAKDMVDGYE